MAVINDLINQVENQALRERLEEEVRRLTKQKKFGLVFEKHLPECVPLYDVSIEKGTYVAKKNGELHDIYIVAQIQGNVAKCIHKSDNEVKDIKIDEIVPVAEFGEPIYPYLKPMDYVCNAEASDNWHTLIEADNYHALQLLEYLYAGKVDCIYIDPPYNTRARDWKYNNDYVDPSDSYRHSKWLSFMERRFKIAKKLLNPKDSVLVVTIDEKEYLHLGMLLEQLFPEARIQMITSVISPRGSARKDMFTRVEEYIFFVFLGNSTVTPFGPDMLQNTEYENTYVKVWAQMIRTGTNGPREKRPNLFYPVFFDKDTGKYRGIGDALPKGMNRNEIEVPNNCFAVFPIRRDGLEVSWALQPDTFREKIEKGYIKFGKWKPGDTNRAMAHLQKGTIQKIDAGEIIVLGKDEEGTVILGDTAKAKRPMSVWNMSSHDAGSKGKNMLASIVPNCTFDYPKSLYAVADTLSFIVKEKKEALIVDFFAGSGTTLHAVDFLNAEDEGKRRCILVTNNEVSDNESKELTKKGFKPGDEEWEACGIAREVTWPRIKGAITGFDTSNTPLKGEYLRIGRGMDEGFKSNAVFFKLGFLDKMSVTIGKQFRELIPLLWMKAGAVGECPVIEECTEGMYIFKKNGFAILTDEKQYMDFAAEIDNNPEIKTIYIVTDSESGYRDMISEFEDKETYQLYRDYLDNFRINGSRR